MAARLVQRCCRRLFGGSTFAPVAIPASLLAPASKTVIARALPQAALASLHTSTLSRQTDKLSVKEQVYSGYPEQREIDELIEAASSPEVLLHVAEHHCLNGNQASTVVIQLSRLVAEKKLETESILQDSRFQQVLNVLNSQLSRVWNSSLLPLLKSLHLLGLERHKRELRSVKQEMRWRLRRLNFRQIASLAEYMAASEQAEDQNELLSDVVKHLELRWTEIGDTRAVVTLMVKVGHLSQTLMDRLEDKALEFAEQFTAEDIRKVALALALQNRRSVPLLRAISYHLVQKHFILSTSVLVDLAFAYGKLNFHQTQVFQKMASDLHARVPEMAHGDVGRCIKSFAYLKWLNLPLFEAFAQYTLDNADRFTVLQLCNVILSFARLNFQPSRSENFYNMVHEKLGDQLGSLDPHLLTDLVWSLCVLQQVKTPYLQSVLAPPFYSQLLDDQTPRGQNYRLKLMHINAAARLECPGYQGPFLPPEALSAPEPPGDRKATPLQSSLQEVLNEVAKDEVNRRFNVHTVYGWQLDAEMMLNSDNQPLPIKDFAAPHLLQSEGTKPLPRGTRRIAFLRWEFPNFSSRSKDLLGRFAMARRQMQAAGFLIVDVPYYEFLELKSEWQKAAYLKDKMNKAVGAEMAK
ncbi:FAST kinase domain-containing protein 4 isoform X1 [Gopherus flavomarginatus]|uniref:FAST kinase domain-containing protein 4 isoform X1 n=2 Tax=Gopherus flavomarginatus TaxID=286002 RepID=UPI0021CC2B9D|nr:FAST kinase domain-containing protein 4 isoform X1 [Gopherus flavomarginatus]XP_050798548.1 FAST kinase domain-containing protein 4 isoform X1 [Gopherus flavomarginatus]XP_050798549.1 FAST kinase domain-containing protein 4 isoform X1 [Gopherus flavomarginatus]